VKGSDPLGEIVRFQTLVPVTHHSSDSSTSLWTASLPVHLALNKSTSLAFGQQDFFRPFDIIGLSRFFSLFQVCSV
jgi:hypothetical protein